MEYFTSIFVTDDFRTAKTKMEEFEKLSETWADEGYVDCTIGPIDVSAVLKEESREPVLAQLKIETEYEEAEHDEKYRDKIRKALKDQKALISVQISLDLDELDAAQWAYLFDIFPNAIVVDDPLGSEVSFAKDIVDEYRTIQEIDLKNPKKKSTAKAAPNVEDSENEEPESAVSKDAIFVDQIFQVLESIQQNHESVYAFKVYLSRATDAQKKFLENLLRRKVKNDKESQLLLAMDAAGFSRFAVQLQKELASLL